MPDNQEFPSASDREIAADQASQQETESQLTPTEATVQRLKFWRQGIGRIATTAGFSASAIALLNHDYIAGSMLMSGFGIFLFRKVGIGAETPAGLSLGAGVGALVQGDMNGAIAAGLAGGLFMAYSGIDYNIHVKEKLLNAKESIGEKIRGRSRNRMRKPPGVG